jgi:competence protein ComEC
VTDPGRPGHAGQPEEASPPAAEGLDLRLLPSAAGAWIAAWGTPELPPGLVLGLAAALALLGCHLGRRAVRGTSATPRGAAAARRGTAGLVVAVALCSVAGAAAASALRVAAVAEPRVAALAASGASARVELVVTSDPRRLQPKIRGDTAEPRVLVRARLERLEARGQLLGLRSPVLVIADERWLRLLPGERVAARASLLSSERGDDVAAVLIARGDVTALGGPGAVQTVAGDLRAGLRKAAGVLPADARGLLPGLVVGDTSAMPASLEDDFRTAGLTHLTAVSGANVAILIGAVLFAGRRVGVPARALPGVSVAALAAFVVLARPEPSVLRASAMGLVGILALATGRRRAGLPSLFAAILVLLLLDPWLARSYGFVLSVIATGALLLLAPRWTDSLQRWLPRPLAAAVAVPAAAQAVCSPVIVLLSAQVSLVAVPANLLVAPAVAPATVLGVLATVTAPISSDAARLLAWLGGLPVRWIVAVGRGGADMPYAATAWPGGLPGALLLAVVLLLLPGAWRVLRRMPARSRRAAAAAGVAGVVVLVVPVASRPAWPPPGWVLVACDVGQGDALVLPAGRGSAVVIDAGPDPEAVDRCLRDLGIRRVALLLLTHLHADHVEGTPGVLRGRQVAEVAVGPVAEPPTEWARVRGWARDAGLDPVLATAGEERAVGDLRWKVLWPQRVIRGDGSVPNNASLVLLVEVGGLRLLLTGDVEPAAQRALRRMVETPVDVLKVPHHGSAAQDPQLFAVAAPRLALVSVGAGNDYGHPAPSTLGLLRSAGTAVLRTDLDGDVAVVGSPATLHAVGRGR